MPVLVGDDGRQEPPVPIKIKLVRRMPGADRHYLGPGLV